MAEQREPGFYCEFRHKCQSTGCQLEPDSLNRGMFRKERLPWQTPSAAPAQPQGVSTNDAIRLFAAAIWQIDPKYAWVFEAAIDFVEDRPIVPPSVPSPVSPDAEAMAYSLMEQLEPEMFIVGGSPQNEAFDILRDALTAATLREREACAQLLNDSKLGCEGKWKCTMWPPKTEQCWHGKQCAAYVGSAIVELAATIRAGSAQSKEGK